MSQVETIDLDFVIEEDRRLTEEGLKLHQRPFHVSLAWRKAHGVHGDLFDERIWTPLMEHYRQLYPTGDFSVPALLTGGVAIRDQMYVATVPLGYGTFKIDPIQQIQIARSELELVYKTAPDEFWQAFYSACDLIDFGFGADDLLKLGTPKPDLLSNARSSLAASPRILSGDLDIDAAVQTSCLTAELALKAALAHLGVPESDLVKLGHRLPQLADRLISLAPRSQDARLATAAASFPSYVGTRYASHGLTRLELMRLARRAQFVAAEAVRRISSRDIAGAMEARSDCPPRGQV